MYKNRFIAATTLLLAIAGASYAATVDQVGDYSGSMTSKVINPLTGAKSTVKSVVLLTIAADNSTTLTIDGVDFLGLPTDNFFGATTGNIVAVAAGPKVVTAPITLKNGSIKGLALVVTLIPPFNTSVGKLKLKKVGVSNPPGFSAPFVSTDVPQTIADLSTSTSSLTLPALGFVTDINVLDLNTSHTFTADLDIFLRSPSGTLVALSTDNGGGGDDFFGTDFDDEATSSITTGTAPFAGTFKPETPLSTFDGEPVAGVWQLIITDDAGADVGQLTNWALEVKTSFF